MAASTATLRMGPPSETREQPYSASSGSEDCTISYKRRWRRALWDLTRSRSNWRAGRLRTRRSRSAPTSRLREAGAG